MNPIRRRRARSIIALTALLATTLSQALPVAAQVPAAKAAAVTSTIVGTIVTQDGLSINNANVTLYQGTSVIATTTSNSDGQYTFVAPPGEYVIVIRANGYQGTRVDNVQALSASTATIHTPLLRTTSNGSQLHEIGSTSTRLNAQTVQSSTTIQHNLDPQQIADQGFLKAGDALGQVPGVNLEGGPHSVGDDTWIDIRGMGTGEVRPLIDGHPVGPIGVLNLDTFDYNNTPYDLLQNIQVTVGSGASGLYGVDVIGGTIDFQTLNPTTQPHGAFDQTFGNDGTMKSIAKATGSVGKLGYAFGHSVMGTYGGWSPQQLFQGYRPNNSANGTCLPATPPGGTSAIPDLTSCNTALNTYAASGDYKVLNDLLKLRYNFNDKTSLTLTGYATNTWLDNTGNGDDDYVPYSTRLAQVQGSPTNCTLPGGGGGYNVITNTNPVTNPACYTAQQLASQSYGGDGGGAGRNRGTSLQDYSAKFETTMGAHLITVSAYQDFYEYRKDSSQSAGLDPTGTFFTGSSYNDDYLTTGLLISDDIASATNDFGFGFSGEHQREWGQTTSYDGTSNSMIYTPSPVLGEGDYSFFIRENYIPNEKIGYYLNAWDRRSSVTQQTTLDPRLSVVYKPTHRDVVRLTGGEADGDPGANVVNGNSISGVTPYSSLNVTTCDAATSHLLNPIASAGNSSLNPERSKDLEAAYGHRFWDDTSVNVVGYVSSVNNQLFYGVVPITAAALANPVIASQLAGYASKISGAGCGVTYTAADIASQLGLNEPINAATALYRGLEFTGRVRVTPQFAMDYDYDIQSSQQFGEPVQVLTNNPALLDGGQIYGVPLHKGSLTFDYNNHRSGLQTQIQGYYIGNNNTLNRPAYTFFNGFVAKQLPHGLRLTLSAENLFNQDAQLYGYFGQQVPYAQNQYATGYTGGAIGQALQNGFTTNDEELGLQPRMVTLTLSAKL
jgi:TonB dependent receptor/Carboxypeptidase regulatory-like domain/TonB-dependent Receptor Plug Domain